MIFLLNIPAQVISFPLRPCWEKSSVQLRKNVRLNIWLWRWIKFISKFVFFRLSKIWGKYQNDYLIEKFYKHSMLFIKNLLEEMKPVVTENMSLCVNISQKKNNFWLSGMSGFWCKDPTDGNFNRIWFCKCIFLKSVPSWKKSYL